MTAHIAVTEDLASCHLLRRIVFIEEQNVSEAEELDDRDGDATHFLATEEELPIGSARMHIKGDTAKIGRVCVIKSHRGTGLGAALIRAAVEEARKESAVRFVKLGAQIGRAHV